MQQFLSDLFNLSAVPSDDYEGDLVRRDTQAAIDAVLNGERWIELQPASSTIRRLQHQMARRAKLSSHSYGKEPQRRVRIFRE
jgi:predicted RNA-binding protein Jag